MKFQRNQICPLRISHEATQFLYFYRSYSLFQLLRRIAPVHMQIKTKEVWKPCTATALYKGCVQKKWNSQIIADLKQSSACTKSLKQPLPQVPYTHSPEASASPRPDRAPIFSKRRTWYLHSRILYAHCVQVRLISEDVQSLWSILWTSTRCCNCYSKILIMLSCWWPLMYYYCYINVFRLLP